MSAPLTQAILAAGANEHTLRRVRIDDMLTTTDLAVFRAPFGTKWHKLGVGRADPELIAIIGAIEEATLAQSSVAWDALHADLPHIDTLKVGIWQLPVAGHTGPVIATPTLGGFRVQLTLVRDGDASVS